MNTTAVYVLFAATGLLSLVAAVSDWKTGRIPNWLIVAGFALAFTVHGSAEYALIAQGSASATEIAGRILGSVVGGALLSSLAPFLLFRAKAMGAGDVKLLAAIGALAGPMMGIEIQFYAFLVTILYTCARLAVERRLLALLASSFRLALNPLLPAAKRRAVPPSLLTSLRFGPAVLAATVLVLSLHLAT